MSELFEEQHSYLYGDPEPDPLWDRKKLAQWRHTGRGPSPPEPRRIRRPENAFQVQIKPAHMDKTIRSRLCRPVGLWRQFPPISGSNGPRKLQSLPAFIQ